MDRSRISAAIPDVTFVRAAGEVDTADIVIVDVRIGVEGIGAVRAGLPEVRIVGFGPHVDDEAIQQARAAGADTAMPRSRFFRDVHAAAFGPLTDR